jgi:hypothetical protein
MANERELLAARMIELYERDRVAVASICDEQLDRSGNLLGYLRAAALRSKGGEG